MYDDYLKLTNNSLSTQYYYGLANGEVGLMVSSGYFYHLYNDDIYFDQCSSLLEMLVKKPPLARASRSCPQSKHTYKL